MKLLTRIMIAALSVGWLIPLSVAFEAALGFLGLTYRVASGQKVLLSWNPLSVANTLFYLAAIWLACVIVGWSVWLTRRGE